MKKIKHSTLLKFLLIILPINLGKHFILKSSYVFGIPVDYLIPTVYLQDILIFSIICLWLYSERTHLNKIIYNLSNLRYIQLLCFFLFSILLSVLTASAFGPSLYGFLRLFLYVLFFLYLICNYTFNDFFEKSINILCYTVLFVSILGIFQFIKQGSVFNNYSFFGEQPYSFSTYGIVKENVFGFSKVPAYGLFKHPNIFGGFLCLILIWILSRLKVSLSFSFNKFPYLYFLSFVFGVVALFLTFSFVAWDAFIFGVLLIFVPESLKKFIYFSMVCLVAMSFLLPFIHIQNKSFERRGLLLDNSYSVIRQHPLFGIGYNNSTSLTSTNFLSDGSIRFNQPVHNIFVLLFEESGLFALLFFSLFLFLAINKLDYLGYLEKSLLYISFFQFLLLASYDHYFVTIPQTQLLFWILIACIFMPDTRQ